MNMTKEGWLVKQGGGWKSWKRRWFVLENKTLFYYKDQLRLKLMGEIQICLAFSIAANDDISTKHFSHVFSIRTPSRVFHISASTDAERDQWINTLLDSVHPEKSQPQSKSISIDDFDVVSLIGKGAFGKVMFVKYKETGEGFALKMVEKKRVVEMEEIEHMMTERNILKRVKHPFLVNLYYSFQTGTHLHYVIDYCPGGELYFHLLKEKSFTEDRTKFYISQIILALECLHQMHVIYRDVKLENVLICADGYLRLTDFGLSKEHITSQDTASTFCGTPEYLCPEIVLAEPYTNVIDWWGVGIMTYEMMHGSAPFVSDNIQQLYHKILYSPVSFPATSQASMACRAFISSMLEKKPEERLNTPEMIKSHPWWKGFEWDELYQKKYPAPWKPDLERNGLSNFEEDYINEKIDIEKEYLESSPVCDDKDLFKEFGYSRDNVDD
ncbi:Protein kinase C [Entamoeba marina]